MARPSTIDNHPRRAEILQAMATDASNLSIVKRFDLAEATVRRNRKTMRANPQAPASHPAQAPRIALPPPSPRPIVEILPPSRGGDDDGLFDVLRISFPWEPGEPRAVDAKAAELRDTQRRHGLVAVREEILTLLGRYRQTKIAPHRIARMLDVPPERITRWLEAKDQFDAERAVTLDPRIRVARRLAEIEDQKAQCAEQLIKPSGQKSFAAIMGLQTRLRADEDRLLEAAGLNKTIFDQRDDGAKSVHDSLFAMFAPIPIAYEVLDEAGIDPDAPTPGNIASGREAYEEFRAEFPDTPIPDFMEDDPWGWRPSTQNGRLIEAHKLATGRKGQYGKMPGDLDPIPGVSYIPPDVSEAAEPIRQQKELAELDQDDPGDAFGEPGCIEPARTL